MEHALTLIGHKDWQCSVCHYKWKSKPSGDCPGLPFYETGSYPDDLSPQGLLFERGLKLAPDQQPVAVTGKYLKYTEPLYALADCIPHGITVTFDQGKYKFEETSSGFTIWRINGLNVLVEIRDTFLHVGPWKFGLYEVKEAVGIAAQHFADRLMPSASDSDKEDAAQLIGKAISWRFYQAWRKLIEQLKASEPEVESLARLMWSSIQGDAPILHLPELYAASAQYIRADLTKYHACRLYAGTLSGNDDPLAKVARWREQLTPTVPNKALNKTLDKMPVAISYRQITRLSTIALKEPITNRLHLIFILCASDHHNWGLHERLVLDATPQMIQEIGQLYGVTLKTTSKTRLIGDVATAILDYPQPYQGDLLGLAQRSREWHRTFESAGEQLLPPETPLVVPPNVDLAALEKAGITLLRTAGDCYKERERMHHCVHTYASKAAHGLCYLFHVHYEHEEAAARTWVVYQATVEVSPQGYVVQAHGPNNVKNPACDYGVTQLGLAFRHRRDLNTESYRRQYLGRE